MIFLLTAIWNLVSRLFQKHIIGALLLTMLFVKILGSVYSLIFLDSFKNTTNDAWIVFNVTLLFLIPISGIVSFFVFKRLLSDSEYRASFGASISRMLGNSEKEKSKVNEDGFKIELVNEEPIVMHNIFNGAMIIGQTGSGKTASIIHPILHQVIDKDWPGLIYDLKGKLCEEVTNYHSTIPKSENRSTKLKFINFASPEKSDRVNPVSPRYLNSKAVAFDFVSTLFSNLMASDGGKSEDPFWFDNAKNILSSIIWFLKNNHPEHCTLPHAIAMAFWKNAEEMVKLVESDPECARMMSSLRISSGANDKKLFINIISTVYTHLMALDLPELFYVLTGDEINLDVNSQEDPTLLTIANYEPLQKVYSPIIAIICNVVTQRMNDEGKRKGAIIFDEFASIKIPNFERIPETIRSRGVSTIIAIHDKQQLVTKYGESKAETIASTLATKFYFKSTNYKTVDEAVKIFGRRDVTFKGKSSSRSTSMVVNPVTNTKGISDSIQERDFLKVEEITNYDRGEFAAIFSDANLKFVKGKKVKLEIIPKTSNSQQREEITKEQITSNYKKVYDDIAALFEGVPETKFSADDYKIDFKT